MDDLQTLAAVLSPPEPSAAVIERGRRQLTEAIGGRARSQPPPPARRRRHLARWTAGGVSLAAAATAAAVIASGVLAPAAPRGHRSTHPAAAAHLPPARLAGQRVLLAAATVAASQRPGRYWHFKIKINPVAAPPPPPGVTVISTYEDWAGRGSDYWTAQPACAAPPGTAVLNGPGMVPWYALEHAVLTYRVTRQLPTSPAALEAWLAGKAAGSQGSSWTGSPSPTPTPAPAPPAAGSRGGRQAGSHADTEIANALIALLWQVPAPPPVRAAAFRALAAFPGVRSLGPVKGGQGLLVSFPQEPDGGDVTLVVDPVTSLVRSESNVNSVTLIEAAGWTDRLPRVIPLPPKNACGG